MKPNAQPRVDLDEVASAVVRVAYMDGLTIAAATNRVLIERRMEYGEATTIMEVARRIVDSNPAIAYSISHLRRNPWMSPSLESFLAKSAQAQAHIEDAAPVEEEPQKPPENPMLPNGQFVFGSILPRTLKRSA